MSDFLQRRYFDLKALWDLVHVAFPQVFAE
jgi:hypothetical protein